MTAFDVNSLNTFGGALNDYGQGPIDPTTDRGAAGANPAYAQVAAMSHTKLQAWLRFQWNLTSAPTLLAHDELWNNNNTGNTAPVVARTGTGTGTVTYPTTVTDEIPSGSPGYSASGYSVNLRAVLPESEDQSTIYFIRAYVSSPNVITFVIKNISGSVVDPTSSVFGMVIV